MTLFDRWRNAIALRRATRDDARVARATRLAEIQLERETQEALNTISYGMAQLKTAYRYALNADADTRQIEESHTLLTRAMFLLLEHQTPPPPCEVRRHTRPASWQPSQADIDDLYGFEDTPAPPF